jgi:prepilin-type N-terminal cleavage/methylation domain-containing protein
MKHKGFTLIELLVAIFIMVLLVLVSIPQFRSFGKKSQTQGTANELKTLIEKTRTLAMAPRQQDNNIKNYQIEINKNGEWVIKGAKVANQSIEVEKGKIDSRTEIEGFYYNSNESITDNSVILGFETPSGRAAQGLNNN